MESGEKPWKVTKNKIPTNKIYVVLDGHLSNTAGKMFWGTLTSSLGSPHPLTPSLSSLHPQALPRDHSPHPLSQCPLTPSTSPYPPLSPSPPSPPIPPSPHLLAVVLALDRVDCATGRRGQGELKLGVLAEAARVAEERVLLVVVDRPDKATRKLITVSRRPTDARIIIYRPVLDFRI